MNLKMFSLIKKLLDIKWKEYKLKIGTYEIDKISLSCFDDKIFVLDDGVHKDSNKKDCNDEKIFVIIEKICNNKKRLAIMEKDLS